MAEVEETGWIRKGLNRMFGERVVNNSRSMEPLIGRRRPPVMMRTQGPGSKKIKVERTTEDFCKIMQRRIAQRDARIEDLTRVEGELKLKIIQFGKDGKMVAARKELASMKIVQRQIQIDQNTLANHRATLLNLQQSLVQHEDVELQREANAHLKSLGSMVDLDDVLDVRSKTQAHIEKGEKVSEALGLSVMPGEDSASFATMMFRESQEDAEINAMMDEDVSGSSVDDRSMDLQISQLIKSEPAKQHSTRQAVLA